VRWESRRGFGRAWVHFAVLFLGALGRWDSGRGTADVWAHGSRLTACCIDWIYLLDGPQPVHRRTLAQVHRRHGCKVDADPPVQRQHNLSVVMMLLHHASNYAALRIFSRPCAQLQAERKRPRQPVKPATAPLPTTTVCLVPRATGPAGTTQAPRAWQLQRAAGDLHGGETPRSLAVHQSLGMVSVVGYGGQGRRRGCATGETAAQGVVGWAAQGRGRECLACVTSEGRRVVDGEV
jgi:hypothetical protein